MIIKEWFCSEHGEFEGSHPICPALGCESEEVVRQFRTAPGHMSAVTKNTDAGFKSIASSYNLTDMSNKDGKSVKGNAHPGAALWGSDAVGAGYNRMVQEAGTATTYQTKNGPVTLDNNGLTAARNTYGIGTKSLPPAEILSASVGQSVKDRSTITKE